MKTTDLMLGDIITFKDVVETDEPPIPIKVIALGYQHHGNENEALVQIGNDECDIVTIDDDFAGYPLTPEILERSGFSLDEFGEWYEHEVSVKERNYWINVAFRNDGVAVYDLDILTSGRSSICIHKDYVHELQHALRLCGIKKEITI